MILGQYLVTALGPNTCMLRRKSPMTGGDWVEMSLPVSSKDVEEFYTNPDRPCIQDAFPTLTAEHREFILTGMDDKAWNDLVGEES